MNDINNLLDVGSDDDVGVGVGDMEDVVGLESTLQSSSLHQLFLKQFCWKDCSYVYYY